MKKKKILFSVLMSTVLFSTSVFAAAWNVPTNVRVVQKSNTDTTGRIYGTIQAAINSITNASATNPYVVKVMPGVYDLGTAALQMKEYVTLEGSGADSTIITSSNTAPDTGDSCGAGTVSMANNSTIRSVKIVNNPTVSGSNAAALVFDHVKAKAEDVSIIIGDDVNTSVFRNIGICASGTAADAKLNNIYVEARNGSGQSNIIYDIDGSSLTITNSNLVAKNTTGNTKMINSSGTENGTATVINCTFEGTSPWVEAFYLSGINTTILNSVISMLVEAGTAPGFSNDSNLNIINTKFSSNSTVGVYYAGMANGTEKISNSILSGYIGDLQGTGAKLFNNTDENLNQIPNQ